MDTVATFDDLDGSAGSAGDGGVTPRPSSRPSPAGTLSPEFSTPTSGVSLSTGGVGTRSSSSSSVGSPELVGVFHCDTPTSFCGGAIGGHGGNHFCCRPVKRCSTQVHRTVKVHLLGGHLYVRGRNPNQARRSPALDVKYLPVDVSLEQFVTIEKSPDVMITYFDNLIARADKLKQFSPSGAPSDDSWESVKLPSVEDLEGAKREMKTPRKLSIGAFLSDSIGTIPVGGPRMTTINDSTNEMDLGTEADAVAAISATWKNINMNFSEIEQEFHRRSQGEQGYRESLTRTLQDLQGSLNNTEAKVQLLVAQIGGDKNASLKGMSTLWESIHSNQVQLEALMGQMEEQRKDQDASANDLDNLASRVSVLKDSFANLSKSYRQLIPQLKDRLGALEGRSGIETFDFGGPRPPINKVSFDIETEVRDLQATLRNNQFVAQTDFAALTRQVGELDSRVLSLPVGGASGSSGSPLTLQAQVDGLRDQIHEMQTRVEDESFVLDPFQFASLGDLKRWVKDNKVVSAGLYWDLFSCLIAMEPKRPTGSEYADDRHSSQRVGSTRLESDLSASMYYIKPRLLYCPSKTGDPVPREKGFGGIKSYGAWLGEGTESLKLKLGGHLHDHLNSVRGKIGALPSGPGKDLANALLAQVLAHWVAFTSHVDRMHLDLVHVSNFTEEVAFTLVGRASNAIWESMRRHRTRVIMLDDLSTLDDKSRMIWSVLQCHREMESFVQLEFRSHPAYVKELSMFMLTERVDPSSIRGLKTVVDKSAKDVKECLGELDKLKESIVSLKRAHENLKGELGNVKRANTSKTKSSTSSQSGTSTS